MRLVTGGEDHDHVHRAIEVNAVEMVHVIEMAAPSGRVRAEAETARARTAVHVDLATTSHLPARGSATGAWPTGGRRGEPRRKVDVHADLVARPWANRPGATGVAPPVAGGVQDAHLTIPHPEARVPRDVVGIDVDFQAGDVPEREVPGIHSVDVVRNRVVADVDVVNIRTQLYPVDVTVVEGVARDSDMIGRDQAELAPKQLKARRRAVAVEAIAGYGRVVEVDLQVESTVRYAKCVSAHRPARDRGRHVGVMQHLVVLELKSGY